MVVADVSIGVEEAGDEATGGEDTTIGDEAVIVGPGEGTVGVETVLLLALFDGIETGAKEGDGTGARSSVLVSIATGPSVSVVITEEGENNGVEVLEGGGIIGAGELRTGAGELMVELEEGVDAVGKVALEEDVVEDEDEEEEEGTEEGAGMIGDDD